MKERRVQRISSGIKKIISEALINDIKDPRINNTKTSVTDVETTNDLSFSYIYISVFGNATQIGRASCREECRSRWSPYH